MSGCCLIVEDDPVVVRAWKSLMQAWGVDARCAASSTDAFGLLDAGLRPQAILCDQRLRSGESGFALLKDLLERCPGAGGAMVSGEFDSPALLQAEREGYLVLRKPVEPAQLHAVLYQWLQPWERQPRPDGDIASTRSVTDGDSDRHSIAPELTSRLERRK